MIYLFTRMVNFIIIPINKLADGYKFVAVFLYKKITLRKNRRVKIDV